MSWICVLKLPNIVRGDCGGKTQLVYKGEGLSTLNQDLFGTRGFSSRGNLAICTDF